MADPSKENENLVRRLLESAVQSACYMVFGMGEQDPMHKGMSSTLCSLLCVGPTGFIAQVGDSRVYLLRGRQCVQLTEDHTLVNFQPEAGPDHARGSRQRPGKNVITRAVGHQDYVEVDTTTFALKVGDRFLLCSDGLHGYLEDRARWPRACGRTRPGRRPPD